MCHSWRFSFGLTIATADLSGIFQFKIGMCVKVTTYTVATLKELKHKREKEARECLVFE